MKIFDLDLKIMNLPRFGMFFPNEDRPWFKNNEPAPFLDVFPERRPWFKNNSRSIFLVRSLTVSHKEAEVMN